MIHAMARRSVLILVAAFFLPACSRFPGFGVPFLPVTVTATLSGTQVVPAVTTAASGTASLTVEGSRTAIDYSISQMGLGTVTSVRILLGAPGTDGPVLFTLTSAPFTNPLTGTLDETGLTLVPSQGINFFSDAVDAVLNGATYIDITTTLVPTGEIRGQLGAAGVAAAILSGGQETAAVSTAGTGSATVQLDPAQSQLVVTLTVSGLTSITGAQIRSGKGGVAGPPAFTLASASFASPLVVTLQATDLLAGPFATFPDAVDALLSGTLYVEVDTTANPPGEIRGQIGPVQLGSALSAANVVPSNSSTATGTGTFVLNGLQTQLTVTITDTVGSPTGARILADVPGSNGPLIFDVGAVAGSVGSPIHVVLLPIDLIPQPSKGISTFTDAVNSMISSKTYCDLPSTGFTAGEIRGQIVP